MAQTSLPLNVDWDYLFKQRIAQQGAAKAAAAGAASQVTDPLTQHASGLGSNYLSGLSLLGTPGVGTPSAQTLNSLAATFAPTNYAGTATQNPATAQALKGLASLSSSNQAQQAAVGAAKNALTAGGAKPVTPGPVPSARQPGYDNTYYGRVGQGSVFTGAGVTPDTFGNTLAKGAPNELLSGQRDWNQIAHMWATAHGLSPMAEKFALDYSNPQALFLLGGQGGAATSALDELNYYGGVMSGAAGASQMGNVDPKQVIMKVLGASGGSQIPVGQGGQIDKLGQYLYAEDGADQDPRVQVSKVITFLKSALQGVVSDDVLNNYLNVLAQQGADFVNWKLQNGVAATKTGNFGRWILDRSGGTAFL